MKRFIRFIALALLLALSGTICGCQAKPADDPASLFLGYLTNKEYARIYALLDPYSKTQITMAQMTDRYNTVYDAIGVTSVEGEIVRREDLSKSRQRVYLSLTITSDRLDAPLQVGVTLEVLYTQESWYLEWTPSMILSDLEEGGRVAYITLTPSRGEIFDRNGNLLAANDHALSVYVQTDEVQDLDTLARIAAPILGMTESQITRKVQKAMGLLDEEEEEDATSEPKATSAATPEPTAAADNEQETAVLKRSVVLKAFPKDGLSEEEIAALTSVAGLKLDTEYLTTIRSYPYGQLLAHILGYTGYITAEDLEKEEYAGLNSDTILGKSGLERAYDEKLRGKQGYELAVYNAKDEKTVILASEPAQDGEDLWLTIDAGTQALAEALLFQYLGADMAGTLVVLDYKSGAVEAAAAYPTYDLNLFSFPLSEQDQEYLYSEDSNSPMFNRVTQGLYPPGSTIKPFVGGKALDENVLTTSFAFDQSAISHNYWHPDDQRWVYPDIKRVSSTPDPLNLRNALIYSDNIFFAYTALQLGEARYRDLMETIGFGLPQPFDLPVSMSRISNSDSFGSMKLLADSGYGQGEMVITPLQMASLFTGLANDGTIMEPYLVQQRKVIEEKKYVTTYTAQPIVLHERILTQNTLSILGEDLKAVVQKASSTLYQMSDLSIAGKSGTAQIGTANEEEIAWFICYNTLGDTPRLVCVTLETPEGQSSFRYQLVIPFYQALQEEDEDD